MGGTVTTPERAAADVEPLSPHEHRRAFGWRRIQVGAAAVTVAALVAPMVIEGEVVGFLAAMAAPFLLGLVLTRFLPRVAIVLLGVVAVAALASSAPFIAEALTHPESTTDFVPQVFFTMSLIIGASAAYPAFRELRRGETGSRRPRAIALGAAVVAVVASATSLVFAAGVDSIDPRPGDATILTRDFEFAPVNLTAEAGTISVHLTNEDSTRHTFTIDGVTDLSVPPNSAQRVTFDAAPGTYRFYCIPHASDMDGVLTVE